MAHSEGLGRGSRFEIRIPLSTTAPAAPRVEAPAAQQGQATTRRVRVVDDNVDAAESLSLLLDIGLPGLNGYEAAMQMRSGGNPCPTLVAVTGWGQQQDRVRAAQAGFDMQLTKPVDPAVIMALARDSGQPALQAYAL